jgi:hypothetical protein
MIGYCKHYGQKWGIPQGYHHRQIYQQFKHLPLYMGRPNKLPKYDVANDQGFPYQQIPFHPNGVMLRGFFQSYKFFDHAKEEVLKAWNLKHYPQLENFTSLHVRRTDYLTHADYFGQISNDYIKEGLEITKPEKVLVFSDDLPWCMENLPKQFPGIEFLFSHDTTEHEDLSRMASCGKNIIANSSFSWVAAYANKNPDAVIVTPHYKSWFGPKSKCDTKDLLPPSWHQIQFR